MNGFDDFDTKISAEEVYEGWTEDEADYYNDGRKDETTNTDENDSQP